jgi:AraC-like DNA-binding protein
VDVLSEVLSACRAQDANTGRFTLRGDWALESAGVHGALFRIAKGAPYWLKVEDDAPMAIGPRDLVLLPHGSRHVIAARPGLRPVPFAPLLAQAGMKQRGEKPLVFSLGEGDNATELFSAVVTYGPLGLNSVIRILPKVIHLREDDIHVTPYLAPTMEMFIEESLAREPGWKLSAARMADLLMVHILRAYLLRHRANEPGWLRGLSDPKIAHAIMLMHQAPQSAWTVAGLADTVCMSRSRFSARFRELVGESPMSYLTSRRMERAAERLRQGQVRLTDLAEQTGYGSDKVFARAFRRWAGMPPSEYPRRTDAGEAS